MRGGGRIGHAPEQTKQNVKFAFFNIKVMKNYFTAIAFFPNKEKKFIKYRNVKNVAGLVRYLSREGAKHVNIYNAKTREFVEQISI